MKNKNGNARRGSSLSQAVQRDVAFYMRTYLPQETFHPEDVRVGVFADIIECAGLLSVSMRDAIQNGMLNERRVLREHCVKLAALALSMHDYTEG